MRRVTLVLLLVLIWPHRITVDHIAHTNKMVAVAKAAPERVIEMTVTAYCPTGHATRSGRMPQVGRTVAVDESIIPLGSKVIVDGREYVAEDTGRLIQGNRLDMFVASRHDAVNFGRRLVQVEIEKQRIIP